MKKILAVQSPEKIDERVRRSKEAVLAATYELLSAAGLGGVSIEAVSKRSGVAKTTIYRHWPSRTALLLDACSKMGTKPEMPETGNLRGDVSAIVFYMAGRLQSLRWSSALPSIIDAAEREKDIAALHSKLHAGFMAPLYTVLERAQKKGELPRSINISHMVARIVGPLFYRRWFSREALDEEFVRNIIEGALCEAKKKLQA
jgi:AcrR family transcriptional regulator